MREKDLTFAEYHDKIQVFDSFSICNSYLLTTIHHTHLQKGPDIHMKHTPRLSDYISSTGVGILLALLAAALYAINAPFSKLLLDDLPPTFMAGFLYLGAGLGMGVICLLRRVRHTGSREDALTRRELPYTIAMILLDIAAPIFLMGGLASISASSASLLNNFEIVATAVIACAIFKEKISPSLWAGILLITVSCLLLSVQDLRHLDFSWGALWVLLAAVCWGVENNCTRKLSSKDPMEIVLLKGIFSGLGACAVAYIVGERIQHWTYIPAAMGVGMVAYGFSIFVYVHAQRRIGAARTSAYYAIAPFLGTALSLLILHESPSLTYFFALAVMVLGAWLAARDAI